MILYMIKHTNVIEAMIKTFGNDFLINVTGESYDQRLSFLDLSI